MTESKSGPREGAEGVVEDVKGKAKEAAGTVFGNDRLQDEGRSQQDKAEHQRDAAKQEAKAEKERAAAEADEREQRFAQND